MTGTAIIVLGPSGLALARKIAAITDGAVHGLAGRVPDADILFEHTTRHLQTLFSANTTIIGICAAGILVRGLGSLATDKHVEPPVIAVSKDGAFIVPLLGGHHGANALARKLAGMLGAHAAITTAGDTAFGLGLDEPPKGWILANRQNAKQVMARLLGGAKVSLEGQLPWLEQAGFEKSENAELKIIATVKSCAPGPGQLVYHPRSLVVGVGCERGCKPAELIALVEQTLRANELAPDAIGCVVSIDLKTDEPAIHALADHFNVPARFFSAERLNEETGRLANPSDIVLSEVGCPGVCEGAALAAVGRNGQLLVEKTKSVRATCAIANAPEPIKACAIGRARGKLSVVGLGPGAPEWRSLEATELLLTATDWVGYGPYLDLAADLGAGKQMHRYDLGAEETRVRASLELAAQGKQVALICSGDAGIYAMASLVFEVIDADPDMAGRRVEVVVAPGISALQAAAARSGAPIGHDFCAISLSDLLTAPEVIEQRLHMAAKGDFVVALYNPRSRQRTGQIVRAMEIFKAHRGPETPVIIAANLGRLEENVRVRKLEEFDPGEVDMFTLVMVGSSKTRTFETSEGKTWVYTPRGYDEKKEAAE